MVERVDHTHVTGAPAAGTHARHHSLLQTLRTRQHLLLTSIKMFRMVPTNLNATTNLGNKMA